MLIINHPLPSRMEICGPMTQQSCYFLVTVRPGDYLHSGTVMAYTLTIIESRGVDHDH